jgi:hypothetical protein
MVGDIMVVRDSKAVDQMYDNRLVTAKCMIIIKTYKGVVGGTKGGGKYYGLMSVQPKLVQ